MNACTGPSPAGSQSCAPCATAGAGASSAPLYALGGASACARCVPGATLVSAAEGCVPPVSALGEPGDTAFFLSGSAFESASALLAAQPQGVSYASSVSGAAGGALALAAGSHLSVPFSAASSTLLS